MNTLDFLTGIAPSLAELLDSAGAKEGELYDFSMKLQRTPDNVVAYGVSLIPHGSTPAEPESIAPPDPDLPGPTQAQLMALWKVVEDFRDKHKITCSETIYQTDRVMEDATTALDDFLEIVGFGHYDEETDEYVGAQR